MLNGFKQFILRGNVVDLAVGVVIGTAFGSVVTSFVKDIITPFIGAVGQMPDLSHLSFTLHDNTFLYGQFLTALVSFVITASVIYFFVVTPLNSLVSRMKKEKPIDPTSKKCPECLSEIPLAAKRCAHCTSVLNQ